MIGIAMNLHDHNTYNGSYHYKAERNNRFKHNYDGKIHDFDFNGSFFVENETVAFSTTMGGIRENPRFKEWLENNEEFYNKIKSFKPVSIWDYIGYNNYYYVDHHCSHAAYTYLQSGFDESDILAIDGLGMGSNSCMFIQKDGKIINLSDDLPLGRLWNICTYAIGFGKLQEGKAMGLAGYGKHDDRIIAVLDYIFSDIHNKQNQEILESLNRFDLAYNLQQFTLEKIEEFILPLKTSENLCVAGGVSYNGYMNEFLTKTWDNVFVPPAPGDEGQAIGCYMHACWVIRKERHIPELYAGKEYEINDSLFDGIEYDENICNSIS
jgi:predicted NodU family carbamoyl transferase